MKTIIEFGDKEDKKATITKYELILQQFAEKNTEIRLNLNEVNDLRRWLDKNLTELIDGVDN